MKTPLTTKWLKSLDFKQSNDGDYDVYEAWGLALSYRGKQTGWMWQVGGTDNMWEFLAIPTQEAVKDIVRCLGTDLDDPQVVKFIQDAIKAERAFAGKKR